MFPVIPQLDDRNFRQILNEALARVRVHNPEWTNLNESDPGVTILELFAFMTESLLYRSNQIPDRNRLKFLQLLGIPLQPPAAATGVIEISNERGPLETITMPAQVPVLAGKVAFLTMNALDVLPVQAQLYLRKALQGDALANAQATYTLLYNSYQDAATDLEFYEAVPVDPAVNGSSLPVMNLSDASTIDRSIWVALLTRPNEDQSKTAIVADMAGKTLTMGIMPALDASLQELLPGGATADQAPAPLTFQIATGQLTPDRLPIYATLDSRPDDNALTTLTLVQLTLPDQSQIGNWSDLDPLEAGVGDFPPSLEDQDISNRLLTWIRISLPETTSGDPTNSALAGQFSWVGINAARIAQNVNVPFEPLGTGTGDPDQSFTLANLPVIEQSVSITVGGNAWTAIDYLLAAPAEVPAGEAFTAASATPGDPNVFSVDRASGVVRFGDGLRGARPPAGAAIVASYAYGGGVAGNVGIGAVKTAPSLPAGFKVSNPVRTAGGSDGESVDDAQRNIPRYLQNRDRAVSAADYKDIVFRTPSIDLGRAEILPLFQPGNAVSIPGAVTVLVIPQDPKQTGAPKPDKLFIDAVCQYLEPRRVLTSEVYVTGPDYVGLSVAVGIDVVPGRDIPTVREAVKDAIRTFLSPVVGGQDGSGWPLGKTVEDREVWARAARVDGLAKVRAISMWDDTGAAITSLAIDGLKLPRLDRVSVTLGDPEDLSAAASVATSAKKRVAVPVLPVGC
jgi:hypothetical protein